jgi:hypothetical protein
MAMNSFHKYVSAIRKSKSFKPVVLDQQFGGHYKVVAKCWDTRYIFGPMLIEEIQDVIGKHQVVITSDHETREIYAFDVWL